MKPKPVLGRGLSALLPGRDDVPRGTSVREIDVDRLDPGHLQPRRRFPAETLAELAGSIREQGILQPIVVVPRDERFEIVAGERRFRAAVLAGFKRVPVIVREVSSDRELLEIALVENLQREDLNAIEAAEAYSRLREQFGFSQERIAERVGKDRTSVANSLRLLKLPANVREMVREGALSAGHARALCALSSSDDQQRLADEIVRRGLSVRQVEARVAATAAGPPVSRERRRDPFTRDAEEKLSRRLSARVRIIRRRRGGKIEISFGSEEELIGLYERLGSR